MNGGIKVCHEYVVENPGKVITQNNFSTLFSKTWMKSMTITNVMAGFSTAGIYPLDRNKVISKLEEAMFTPLKQPSKLSYLPLLTPVPSPSISQSSKKPIIFSEAEIKLFLERYEDGYDGKDERYKIWLKMYHPDADSISSASLNESVFHTPTKPIKTQKDSKIAHVAISKPTRKIEKLFSKPMAPSKLPTKSEKSSGRVLTSSEALKLLKEKEEKKSATKKQKELCHKNKANKSQVQEEHNDVKEIVEENIKIKGNEGTKNKAYFIIAVDI